MFGTPRWCERASASVRSRRSPHAMSKSITPAARKEWASGTPATWGNESHRVVPYLVLAECENPTATYLSDAQQRSVRESRERGDDDAGTRVRERGGGQAGAPGLDSDGRRGGAGLGARQPEVLARRSCRGKARPHAVVRLRQGGRRREADAGSDRDHGTCRMTLTAAVTCSRARVLRTRTPPVPWRNQISYQGASTGA